MDNNVKAKNEINEVLNKLEVDRDKVKFRINEWKKDNNWKGLDNPFMKELKELTTEAFEKIDKIKTKYNIND